MRASSPTELALELLHNLGDVARAQARLISLLAESQIVLEDFRVAMGQNDVQVLAAAGARWAAANAALPPAHAQLVVALARLQETLTRCGNSAWRN